LPAGHRGPQSIHGLPLTEVAVERRLNRVGLGGKGEASGRLVEIYYSAILRIAQLHDITTKRGLPHRAAQLAKTVGAGLRTGVVSRRC
jgi:hypothetical protein